VRKRGQGHEDDGRIMLGEDTGGGMVMLRLISGPSALEFGFKRRYLLYTRIADLMYTTSYFHENGTAS
jgi:hypothetical protein